MPRVLTEPIRPRLLDLFCGAGGAAMGYYRAGFDVIGVDHKPMPRYPFEFHQSDALEYLAEHGHEFDAIHASPPCQGYSRLRHLPWLKGKVYPMLIPITRKALQETHKLWVIENVGDAPLNGAQLCGLALGLNIIRHRRFESNILLLFPPCPGHPIIEHGSAAMATKYRGSGVAGIYKGDDPATVMGIGWMTKQELTQAIPPAYTEFIGLLLIQYLEAA
jgi:DNA (cytosine-5)-methyltransferase 1